MQMRTRAAFVFVASCGGAVSTHHPDQRPSADVEPGPACFRGETRWSVQRKPGDTASDVAPAYLTLTFDPVASTARADWLWSNPADPSHPLSNRTERWQITGNAFVVSYREDDPRGLYKGEFLAGSAWPWAKWRIDLNDPAIELKATYTYEWAAGRLHSSGHKQTGSPGDAAYLLQEQQDELVQVDCNLVERAVENAVAPHADPGGP